MAYDRWRVRLDADRHLVVMPYEVDEPDLAIAVDAIELADSTFPSHAALAEAIDAAPRVRLEGRVGGGRV